MRASSPSGPRGSATTRLPLPGRQPGPEAGVKSRTDGMVRGSAEAAPRGGTAEGDRPGEVVADVAVAVCAEGRAPDGCRPVSV